MVGLAARAGSSGLRRLGVARRLAAENLGRHPRRTSSTTNALIVGLFLVTVVPVAGSSVKSWAVEQINQLSSADVILLSLTEVPVTVANPSRSTARVARDARHLVRGLFRIRRWAKHGRYDEGVGAVPVDRSLPNH